MKIRGKDSKTGQIREGQLHLVDLAGSERLARSCSNEDPKLLSEAKAINKSLSEPRKCHFRPVQQASARAIP